MNGARDAAAAFARALVDEWVRAGVGHACVAPGSRSTPLALALADDERVRVHISIDERSAAFLALGVGRASGRPAVVLCTSGTAVANLHPAVLEAFHGRVPLLVCTADRPPELLDTGAGQTIDQRGIYGGAVRWSTALGPPTDVVGAGAGWRSVGARSVSEAVGPPAGPVHLNLAFREPLVPTGAPLVEAPGRSDGRPWTAVTPPRRTPDDETVARLAEAVQSSPRGLLVAGWGAELTPRTAARFADAAGWPILADPVSGLRWGPTVVSTYDALLRSRSVSDSLRPELVLRVGATTTGKVLTHWLGAEVPQIVVDADRSRLDPERAASEMVETDAEVLLTALAHALGAPRDATSDWLTTWLSAEDAARRALDATLDGWPELSEPRIARDVYRAVPEGGTLVVASSMPVRDVESFAAPRRGLRVLANRGVNGIDGFTSTVLGVATASDGPVVALAGDLCFLHDSNGLLGAADRSVDAVLVVVDNRGGGIFHFLPQADDPTHFEEVFATPPSVDLAALAGVHGLPVEEVTDPARVAGAITDAVDAGGVRVVLARTDRARNVDHHREAWAAVGQASGFSAR
jgi:2-succinyl-5-enolpyruvyl-6-hydroxy-3-cyclohexene-1-carboxylate synthase